MAKVKPTGEKSGKTSAIPIEEPALKVFEPLALPPAASGKFLAGELFEIRVAEVRQRAEEGARQGLVEEYREQVAESRARWAGLNKDCISELRSAIADWKAGAEAIFKDRDRLKSRLPPSPIMHINGEPVEGRYKVVVKSESLDELALLSVKVSVQLGAVIKLVNMLADADRRSLLPDSANIHEQIRTMNSAANKAKMALDKKLPPKDSLDALETETKTFASIITRASDFFSSSTPAKDLTEVPQGFQKRLPKSLQNSAEEEERQYRSSNEARYLRLMREIQVAPDEAFISKSSAQRSLRQLQGSVSDLTTLLSPNYCPRLAVTPGEISILREMISRLDASPEQANSEVPDFTAPEESNDTENSDIAPEQDTELIILYLEHLGISDREVIAGMLPSLSVECIELAERELNNIPAPVIMKALQSSPDLIFPGNEMQLRQFVKQFHRTAAEVSGLESYQIFNPTDFPQFFCSLPALERTLNAAALIRKVTGEVTAELMRNRPAPVAPVENGAQTEGEGPAVHPEQHLIDRLGQHVTYPNLAYGLLRDGFFYQGAYHNCAVPQGFRDKLMRSTFTRPPHPKDLRLTERELLGLGLIVNTNVNQTGASDTLAIAMPNDVPKGELHELLIALLNVQSRPTRAPKLQPR